jgi:hypothetical protein
VTEKIEDLSSGKDVRKRKSKVRLADEQLEKDLDVVLNSISGRRMLWSLLVKSAIFQDPFVGDDALKTAYLLGKQAFGKEVFAMLMDPKRIQTYVLMVEESSNND